MQEIKKKFSYGNLSDVLPDNTLKRIIAGYGYSWGSGSNCCVAYTSLTEHKCVTSYSECDSLGTYGCGCGTAIARELCNC
jgi:hypothetical protein